MAVFVAASDETDCGNDRGTFFHCGFVAPEFDWYNIFTAMWKKKVLAAAPRIPYFHMNGMRNKQWCEQHGIDRKEAEFRITEAFGVIDAVPRLYPIACEFNAGHVLDIFKQKVKFETGARRRFEPDYLGFIGYVDKVLQYLTAEHPEATRVDFIVEAKEETTNRIREFFERMPADYHATGYSHFGNLIGALIPVTKVDSPRRSDDCLLTHAADLLSWYTRRAHERALDDRDVKRYSKIATREGERLQLSDAEIEKLYEFCVGESDEESIQPGAPFSRP
jgi:hypothetical protein